MKIHLAKQYSGGLGVHCTRSQYTKGRIVNADEFRTLMEANEARLCQRCILYVAKLGGPNDVNPNIAYRGRVVARDGDLLTGGVRFVESSLFKRKTSAEHWVAAVEDENGERVKLSRVITVNLSGTGIDRNNILD